MASTDGSGSGGASADQAPYPSLPIAQSHPERMATAATLLGLSPAEVESCRILELGCGSGGNLIPMAVQFPFSRFLGLDPSEKQIRDAQEQIRTLGLRNIEFRTINFATLLDATLSSIGVYDYILCHGVYSWVPKSVQDAILTLCQRHLAPQGIAYVSYNTLPGFYNRQPLREMMLFHLEQTARQKKQSGALDAQAGLAPHESVGTARAFMDILRQGVSDPSSSWAQNLKREAELLRSRPDPYLLHEHLAVDNHPCYFHEFIAAARSHGLMFLTEAEPLGSLYDFPPAVQEALTLFLGDVVVLEQYLDFLRYQPLRCTLLCHASETIEREPSIARIKALSASCAIWPQIEKPLANAELRSEAPLPFRSPLHQMVVRDPVFKAVLYTLFTKEPRALSFAEVLQSAETILGDSIDDDVITDILLCGYNAGLLRLHVTPPKLASEVSEKPQGSSLARVQARTQTAVTNLLHQTVELAPLEQLVLILLDGQHDLTALVATLTQAAQNGLFVIEQLAEGKDGGREEERTRKVLSELVPISLQRLCRSALLQK